MSFRECCDVGCDGQRVRPRRLRQRSPGGQETKCCCSKAADTVAAPVMPACHLQQPGATQGDLQRNKIPKPLCDRDIKEQS